MSFRTNCGAKVGNGTKSRAECGARVQGSERFGLAAFLDTETTGLAEDDEVIELSIALFEFDREAGSFVGSIDRYTGLREPHCIT